MNEILKPIPKIDNDSKVFWDGCNDGKLLIQYCNDCNRYIYYPRICCPHCMSSNFEWKESNGRGRVYSYTIVRYGAPGFQEDVPYIVALVELNEGVRMITNIIDCNLNDIKCDLLVEVDFIKRENVRLPMFRPTK